MKQALIPIIAAAFLLLGMDLPSMKFTISADDVHYSIFKYGPETKYSFKDPEVDPVKMMVESLETYIKLGIKGELADEIANGDYHITIDTVKIVEDASMPRKLHENYALRKCWIISRMTLIPRGKKKSKGFRFKYRMLEEDIILEKDMMHKGYILYFSSSFNNKLIMDKYMREARLWLYNSLVEDQPKFQKREKSRLKAEAKERKKTE